MTAASTISATHPQQQQRQSTATATSSTQSSPTVPSSKSIQDVSEYQIRPPYSDIFKPREVKAIMKEVMESILQDQVYDTDTSSRLSKEVATSIKNRLKEIKLGRYKFLVQVMIGEQKGAGIRIGARCLWDQQTDKLAQETYQNASLFCVAVAFGVYLY